MKRALLLLAVALSGCFNPDDLLPISGKLVSDGGVGGQRVELFRGEVPTRAGGCPSPRLVTETTAAADGTFTVDVLRAQAQRLTLPGGFCFQAKTRFESGTTAVTTFRNVNAEYALPPMRDWRPGLRPDAGVRSFLFSVAPRPELEGPGGFADAHRAELVTEDGGLVWARPTSSVTSPNAGPKRMTFTDEELEDFGGTVQLVSRFVFAGIIVSPGQHEHVQMELRAGQTFPFVGTTIPFSRGLSCPPFEDPCPFTDGSLQRVDGGGLTTLSLRWPLPRLVQGVLLRGVEAGPTSITARLIGEDGGVLQQSSENWVPTRWDVPIDYWPADEFVPLETQLAPGERVTMAPRFVSLYFSVLFETATGIDLTFDGGLTAMTEFSVLER